MEELAKYNQIKYKREPYYSVYPDIHTLQVPVHLLLAKIFPYTKPYLGMGNLVKKLYLYTECIYQFLKNTILQNYFNSIVRGCFKVDDFILSGFQFELEEKFDFQ